MFENPRRCMQARNFTTTVPKILDLKSSSEQIFCENWRWVPLRGGSFPLFSHWRLIFRKVVIEYSCKLWRGWRKVFLDIKCHVILKTSTLVCLCCNYIKEVKARFRLYRVVVLAVEMFPIAKRFDGDDSFAIPILYIEKGFCKVKKWVKISQLLCSHGCRV